jgi:hypothetical protein
VLALTDEALALVCIAAGRLPAEERGTWLEDLAEKLARKKGSRAASQKAYRARQEAGLMVLQVRVHDVAVPEMLAQAGLLQPNEIDDRKAAARAVERLIETIIRDRYT